MSHIARSIAFPASGAAAWPVGAPPPWRGGKPSPAPSRPGGSRATFSPSISPMSATCGSARRRRWRRCWRPRARARRAAFTIGVEHVFAAHEPVVVAGHGAEIWGALTNTALHSRALDDPYWTAANLAIAPNAAPGPDGVLSMEKLAADGSAALRASMRDAGLSRPSTATSFQAVVAARERSLHRPRLRAPVRAGAMRWFDSPRARSAARSPAWRRASRRSAAASSLSGFPARRRPPRRTGSASISPKAASPPTPSRVTASRASTSPPRCSPPPRCRFRRCRRGRFRHPSRLRLHHPGLRGLRLGGGPRCRFRRPLRDRPHASLRQHGAIFMVVWGRC